VSLLFLLALGVAWQAVRAVAWHGWAIAEAAVGLAVVVIVAGARADTAKAYETEKRLNNLTKKHQSTVQVGNWNVGNGGMNPISATLTIPANAVVGTEFEIYAEGDGTWGLAPNRQSIQLWIAGSTQAWAASIVNFDAIPSAAAFAWWMRGTFTIEGAGGSVRAVSSGCLWVNGGNMIPGGGAVSPVPPAAGSAPVGTGTIFGHVGSGGSINPAAPYTLTLNAQWLGNGGAQMHITGYKTRITRRGS
jgi:hypothetical protein